ncbi:MAG: phosphate ABC transporter permease subunit PstC [Oscillospiraceae bacterium]
MRRKILDKGSQALFLLCALMSVIALCTICFFIFKGAVPAIREIGLWDFISGSVWKPNNKPQAFGIFNMIVGSLYVTAGGILMGVPVGVLAAVYMARLCPRKIYPVLSQAVSLLAGIPSIIYGFFGMMVIVPFIQKSLGGNGNSVLAASIVLAVMILPTIISISEASLRALPEEYHEGALALGATREASAYLVMLPAARSGVVTAIMLGIGRAIGETIAVVMVAGNASILPESVLKPVRTLTSNIVLEMNYASGLHFDALIATAAVLFLFILLLNVSLRLLTKGEARV